MLFLDIIKCIGMIAFATAIVIPKVCDREKCQKFSKEHKILVGGYMLLVIIGFISIMAAIIKR